ncbi:MAG: 1-(5-phosphoribosyl)-5-[(5-phosphoribosylamino)methylideneamino]imidazole-4-carboxamide isomerase [Ignavibacteriales bacterium]|nr:1-(5-phosphoribosyl)-5-[(5-phosphoribosylamino)methylideneamino]imidazole-4-carboxamide isomerase [Ignavibacteriales bacterium]
MVLLVPAIDIRDGKCVRLVQGEPGTEKIYSNDPVQMAILWRGENAKCLHVVDLDGAFGGTMKNLELIHRIVTTVDIPIQIGGGIRTFEQVKQLIEIGVYRVVLGTAAIDDPELVSRSIAAFGKSKIAIGIDAKNGVVMTKGWKNDTGVSAVDLAMHMKERGVCRIVYTDISRDGMLGGPNFEATKEIAVKSGLRVTASGGVSSFEDLRKIQELERFGVDSVIVGKALYENRFPCEALWRLNEKKLDDLGPTRRI